MELISEILNKITKENIANDLFCDNIKKDNESIIELLGKIGECDNPAVMVTIRGVTTSNLKGILLIYSMMVQKGEVDLNKINQITRAITILETNVKSALTLKNEKEIKGIIGENPVKINLQHIKNRVSVSPA